MTFSNLIKIPICKLIGLRTGIDRDSHELCSAALDAESTGDGGEDGDEEVDDGFPIFFFHVISDSEV